MYLISFIAIIIVITIGSDFLLGLPMSSYNLLDLPTLILLLVICIPFLISAGLIKDFNNAFTIALSRKKDVTLNEIKRSKEAVSLTIRALLCSGFLIFLMAMIAVLHSMDTPESLGPHIAVAVLSLLYSCVLTLLLLPLKSILNLRIIEYMSEAIDEIIPESEHSEFSDDRNSRQNNNNI